VRQVAAGDVAAQMEAGEEQLAVSADDPAGK